MSIYGKGAPARSHSSSQGHIAVDEIHSRELIERVGHEERKAHARHLHSAAVLATASYKKFLVDTILLEYERKSKEYHDADETERTMLRLNFRKLFLDLYPDTTFPTATQFRSDGVYDTLDKTYHVIIARIANIRFVEDLGPIANLVENSH